MSIENLLNRDAAVRQVRRVIERLVHDGSVMASSDGTERSIFPVAVSPVEAEGLRDWVYREGAAQTIESVWPTKFLRYTSAKACF